MGQRASVGIGSWHARRIPGIRMCWRRLKCRYDFFLSTFAIPTMPIKHFVARKRETLMLSSDCLLAGANLSWLGYIWASGIKLEWERTECVLQGESSHAGS